MEGVRVTFDPAAETRQEKVDKFLRWATIGTICLLVTIMAAFLEYGDRPSAALPERLPWLALVGIPALGVALSLLQLFRLRHGDEFVERLWYTSTSAAFIAVLAASLIAAFGAGIATDLKLVGGNPDEFLCQAERLLSSVSLLAFFGALQFKRLKGS
jgi:lysylphosphatidylglycerol synthetase-like protein (DUF2156 family)